ncbi:MAG: alpha/beta hydrolase [Balneolales bacterium]|nr:alpha/beta hydrolase [Balneolales bacterium]
MKRRSLFFLSVIIVFVLFMGITYSYFLYWRAQIDVKLPGSSQVAETRLGPVEYALHGDGSNTILLLHGTPGPHTHLNVDVLTDAGYSVLIVARPGYLRTPIETGRLPEEQADAYRALLDDLNIDNVFVLGISGGGPSALQFALRHQDRTKSLIMYGAVSKAIEFASPRLADRITNTEFGLWIANNWVISRTDDPDNKKIAEYYLNTIFPISAVESGLQNDLRNMENLPDYPIDKISVPILVLHGTEDRVVLFSHGHFVATNAPDATLVRLEGASHDGLITDFDKNMELVIRHLQEHH